MMKLDVLTMAVLIFSIGVCVSAMDLEDTLDFAQQNLPVVFQKIATSR